MAGRGAKEQMTAAMIAILRMTGAILRVVSPTEFKITGPFFLTILLPKNHQIK
jgi:hypothetical protein